jgi:quercetin 2,3-dioxygenase
MFSIRRASDRGHTQLSWLESHHSFSFGEYHDPQHMGFSDLRVINQDRVQPGKGFGTHGHSDMEIITYVINGALSHRDSMGNVETLQAGEMQRMTAGTGVQHSEFNANTAASVEFLQIWVVPNKLNLAPEYQQITLNAKPGWQLSVSPSGENNGLKVNQDIKIWRGQFLAGETFLLPVPEQRSAWLQIVSGSIKIGQHVLNAGDAVAVKNQSYPDIETLLPAELLLFDLR